MAKRTEVPSGREAQDGPKRTLDFCWNPGVGSCVCFSTSFLSFCFSPFHLLSNSLLMEGNIKWIMGFLCSMGQVCAVISNVMLHLLFCQCSLIFHSLPLTSVWFLPLENKWLRSSPFHLPRAKESWFRPRFGWPQCKSFVFLLQGYTILKSSFLGEL